MQRLKYRWLSLSRFNYFHRVSVSVNTSKYDGRKLRKPIRHLLFNSKIVRNSTVIIFQPLYKKWASEFFKEDDRAWILIVKEQILFAWCYITNLFLVRPEFGDISFMASWNILVPTLFDWRFFHFLDVFCLGYAHASVWLCDGWTKVNNAIGFFFNDL